jgi:hypothetical protein
MRFCCVFILFISALSGYAQEAPEKTDDPSSESPLMLYLVPWNANPETNKNAKKLSLYKPWGNHFDPMTPQQQHELLSPASE